MKINILSIIKLIISFIPFILFVFFDSKANVKKEVRHRQYLMPAVAVAYSIIMFIFINKLSDLFQFLFLKLGDLLSWIGWSAGGDFIYRLYASWGIYLVLVLFNTVALLLYVIIKRILTLIFKRIEVRRNTVVGSIVELFYIYDEADSKWYIKEHFGQARTFFKIAFYGGCFVSGLALLISCGLCMNKLIAAPFYPVFAVIIIGEIAFFIDGVEKGEQKPSLSMQSDRARRIAMYPLLRKPLKALFGDKLSADGTAVNDGGMSGGAVEDILVDLEKNGNHIGKNYAGFIRRKMEVGLRPNVDYVRSGYELAIGKSLLFNTPFYYKLNPYVFYAMNRALLTGGKILIVLGRHGTEDDLYQWCHDGMTQVSNIPGLWNISVLSAKKCNEYDLPDIGIISRSGVHDLDIQKNNLPFLNAVSFVVIVEPSRLVTTAQIGLNLLVKSCGKDKDVVFCSVDRNCDGLVDALSHILMTNITEVSATEYPRGMSSYMYWTADDDYLQHRILPGVSRYLGMGTELSAVALKNQVEKTVWYGGDAFPVQDARWIAKQYYFDLLDYAKLPANQEMFDKSFQTSFNMCNEKVREYSYVTVEDDRYNLFETRRNFATIAEQQGFVNVISSEYMLREYMAENTDVFTADAKAIPYITADYARTKRNAILSLCMLLCVGSVLEDTMRRHMVMMNHISDNPIDELWKEICVIFCVETISALDKDGNPILSLKNCDGKILYFEKDEIIKLKREYYVETGKFESVYTIENSVFANIILDDLQNATYIAEQESRDEYIGTELKGHVYQKYLPGQFFTLNGKYYEMVSTTADNRILVRRAADHIMGRLFYRQVRTYCISRLEDACSMGALKTVNNIDVHYQFADFSVETSGYWKLGAYNDFDNGSLITVNGVPAREYHHKQILKLDFSKLGDAFTDSVRMTLTNLLNEVFVTLFAENQSYISAITPGLYDAPMTYSLSMAENTEVSEKCIFIIEDSQLDIGLLVAVERNINRIFQIISDYLGWNEEQITESLKPDKSRKEHTPKPFDVYGKGESDEKNGFFGEIGNAVKGIFKKKDKDSEKPKDAIGKKTLGKEDDPAESGSESAVKKNKKDLKSAAKIAKKKDKLKKTQGAVDDNEEQQTFEGDSITTEENVEKSPAEESVAENLADSWEDNAEENLEETSDELSEETAKDFSEEDTDENQIEQQKESGPTPTQDLNKSEVSNDE